MDRILVEIYLPALGRAYDVYIPLAMRLHEVRKLLNHALGELSGGTVSGNSETILCDRETGMPFDINSSALELNLKNGSRLMLI